MSEQSSSNELLPCPFCGDRFRLMPGNMGVQCGTCTTVGPVYPKITNIARTVEGGYVIYMDDLTAYFQRSKPQTVSDSALQPHEELILALIDKFMPSPITAG